MPELPEVETVCRQLQKKMAGKEIIATVIYDSKLAHVHSLKGMTIAAVQRHGKMIEIIQNQGDSVFIHLRMTGRLHWQEDSAIPAHCRFRISFSDGHLSLIDPRRFATIKVGAQSNDNGKIDIMLNFDSTAFIKKNGCRKTSVKNLIMDQNAVSGIGNIYACEILHSAGVHPARMALAISKKEWRSIFSDARRILQKAITKRGTSISDWRDLYGQKGENQFELKVYGREGEKCINCGNMITRIKQGGRSTFFCPRCQK